MINEIQTGGVVGGSYVASDEFVELYNPNDCSVSLSGYKLLYRSSAGTTDQTIATLGSVPISAHGFLVYGGTSFTGTPDGALSSGLKDTGGGVALSNGTSIIHSVGWGDATNAYVEVSAAPAPDVPTPTMTRSIGLSPDGTLVKDNSKDFSLMTPTPGQPNQ